MHKVVDYINKTCDLGDEYFRLFGKIMPTGKFSCPNPEHIHSSNTPSCKRYGNVFKCFGQCNRVFGVYDLLKWYDPGRINELKSKVVMSDSTTTKKELITPVRFKSNNIRDIIEEITGICL